MNGYLVRKEESLWVGYAQISELKTMQHEQEGNVNETTIEKITKGIYGEVKAGTKSEEYSEIFEMELQEYKDDSYTYLFDKDKIKVIMLDEKNGTTTFGKISNEKQAQDIASTIVEAAGITNLQENYDIFVKKVDFEDSYKYNVEFWEKIASDFYSGNKISVILMDDGYLDSFCRRDTGVQAETCTQEVANVTKEKATEIAYNKAEKMAEQMEESYHSIQKETDEQIISDAELLGETTQNKIKSIKKNELNIKIEDKTTQQVKAYREVKDGKVVWVVDISNVEVNNDYGEMEYIIEVDAETGIIVNESHTR